MKSFSPTLSWRRQRGSALVTVILFSFVLLTLAGSVMQWSLSERRLNSRSGYWLEARNAAEAVAEYGCYSVAQTFNRKMNPSFGSSGTDPISFPSTIASAFFSSSHVNTSSIVLQAGTVTQVPASGLYYIDPNDPNNKYDPMVGRYCYRRDVTVLSKATVTPSSGGGPPVTSYIEEKVSVRGAPLFAYAIFYSANDLEFGESPQMDIYGPVHVNGNLFVGPAGSSPAALSFHGPVSASGNVYHAWRGTSGLAQEGSSTISSTTPVNFSTDTTLGGSPFNMKTSAGVWNDSTMGADSATNGLAALQALVTPARKNSFNQYASQTWHGNLQTAAMGIQAYNPMGFSEIVSQVTVSGVVSNILATDNPVVIGGTAYTPDDNATVGTTGTTYNNGLGYTAGFGHGYGPHALIEPAMAAAPATDPFVTAKASIEEGKFARKAGLYIKVNVTSGNVGTITLYGDPHSAATPISTNPNGGIQLATTGDARMPTNIIQFIPYTTATVSGNTVVTQGMYDQHQSKGVNLVQIDMAALKTALTHMTTASAAVAGTDIIESDTTTKWGSGTANIGFDEYTAGSTGWNGGIYIEVNSSSTNHTAVMLANGKIASGSTLTPAGASAPNSVTGLTIATNAPAYILGNFNADGTIAGTGAVNNSALYPDDAAAGTTASVMASAEAPVAIAADAVTVLSPNYFGTDGGTNLAPSGALTNPTSSARSSITAAAPYASSSVEIAAAIISGTIATSPDSTGSQVYSGGVHNLPRFLETWNSAASGHAQYTVAIRGAMVSMYNSRVATAGWSQAYYSAPIRQWGFDQIFANGKFPPICPQVISYRRVDFTYLKSATEYATEVSHL